jgi:hypothetical protein
MYKNKSSFVMYFMPFEGIDADDSDNSLGGVSSLDKDYTKMRFESSSFAEKSY